MILLICVILTTLVMILWFGVVLMVAKHRVGKDATIQQILLSLFLAGPIGWIIILIIFVYDIVDKISQKKFKKFKKSIDK